MDKYNRSTLIVFVVVFMGVVSSLRPIQAQEDRDTEKEGYRLALLSKVLYDAEPDPNRMTVDLPLQLAVEAARLSDAPEVQQTLRDIASVPGNSAVRFEGHSQAFIHTTYSPDGKIAATGGFDNNVILWDVETGDMVRKIETPMSSIYHLEYYGDWIMVAGFPGIMIVDADSGELVHFHHLPSIRYATINPERTQFVTADETSTLFVHDMETGEVLRELTGHNSIYGQTPMESIRFSPDGTRMASAGEDETFIVWDAQTGEMLYQKEDPNVSEVMFSPDGSKLLSVAGESYGTGYRPGNIAVWDVESGTELFDIAGRDPNFDGDEIVTIGDENTVIFWSSDNGEILRQVPLEGNFQRFDYVWGMTLNADEIIGYEGVYLYRWDRESGEEVARYRIIAGGNDSPRFSPDNNLIAFMASPGVTVVYDRWTGEFLYEVPNLTLFEFSPDTRLMAGLREDTLVIVDAKTGDVQREIETVAVQMAFHPESTKIATSSADGDVVIWNVETGEQEQSFEADVSGVNRLQYRADGEQVMISNGGGQWYYRSQMTDGVMVLWNTRTQVTERVSGLMNPQYSPNGFMIGAHQNDKLVIVSPASGTIMEQYRIEGETMTPAFAFSPSNLDFAGISYGNGGTMLVNWRLGEPLPESRSIEARSDISDIAFTRDSRWIAANAVSTQGSVLLWSSWSGTSPYRLSYSDLTLSGLEVPHQLDVSPDGLAILATNPFYTPSFWSLAVPSETDGDLLAWVLANRYVPPLTCTEREEYQVRPLCSDPDFKLTP